MTRMFSFGVLLSFVTASLAAVSDVEAGLSTIASQVTALSSAISAFPTTNGNILSALAIHNQATELASALAAAATDVADTPPVNNVDGQTILGLVEDFAPTILGTLAEIDMKLPGFETLPIAGSLALVAQDLATLKSSTKQFENALIADTPADLLSVATPLTSTIDAAMASASAFYASAAAA